MNDETRTDSFQEEEDLASALEELAALVKPAASENKISIDIYYYLLLLWASFHVYPLEPLDIVGNKLPEILPLQSGLKAFDYGDCVSVSPGEHYSSYCTGRLIESVIEIIAWLYNKGITKVGFLGHDIAKRAAWIECYEHGIQIVNYEPTDFDWEVRNRLMIDRQVAARIRQQMQHKKKD